MRKQNLALKKIVLGMSVAIIVLFISVIYLTTNTIPKLEIKAYELQNEVEVLSDYSSELVALNSELESEKVQLQSQVGQLEEQLMVAKQEQLALIEPFKETDKEQYYLAYKDIISALNDQSETIYDVFTEEELNNLFNVVQVEAEAGGFLEKANVASVIFNRLNSGHLGADELNDVLMNGGFSSIWSPKFNNMEISETTILACEYAFEIEDTTNGCMYFESCDGLYFGSFAEYVFTDDIGHDFYRE